MILTKLFKGLSHCTWAGNEFLEVGFYLVSQTDLIKVVAKDLGIAQDWLECGVDIGIATQLDVGNIWL